MKQANQQHCVQHVSKTRKISEPAQRHACLPWLLLLPSCASRPTHTTSWQSIFLHQVDLIYCSTKIIVLFPFFLEASYTLHDKLAYTHDKQAYQFPATSQHLQAGASLLCTHDKEYGIRPPAHNRE
jgi:hypothetical protein